MTEPKKKKARQPSIKTRQKSCTCHKCVGACKNRPGWMMPHEAMTAIKAGLAHKLMRDWVEPCEELKNKERIWVLAPASVSYEGKDAPEMDWWAVISGNWSMGRCVFLENARCSLHNSGFKPHQCRLSVPCDEKNNYNDPAHEASNISVGKAWDTAEGKRAMTAWKIALKKVKEVT